MNWQKLKELIREEGSYYFGYNGEDEEVIKELDEIEKREEERKNNTQPTESLP